MRCVRLANRAARGTPKHVHARSAATAGGQAHGLRTRGGCGTEYYWLHEAGRVCSRGSRWQGLLERLEELANG